MSDNAAIEALGHVPSGVFVLTARQGDDETGMLASWVQQAGFEPPAVTVAIRHGRYVAEWISAGAPFVLNAVAEGDKATLQHFGRGFEPGASAFEGLTISRSAQGVVILDHAAAHLECTAKSHVDSADHRVFVAEVSEGRVHESPGPMVHIRNTGAHY